MELKKYKLGEIIETFITGDWGNETISDDCPYAVKCVRGADIVPIWNSDFKDIPTRFISNRSYKTKLLNVGDIIIEKSGGSPTQSTGRTAFVSDDLIDSVHHLVCTNFCTAFKIKIEWNAKYVYYYFQYLYNNNVFFNFEGKTSGLKNLQLETAFNSINIPQLPLEKQKEIVDVLDSLNQKIALNRRINAKLEQIAKRLYDYWFVQFDFPDKNGKPYKSNGGKMVWNEVLKREVPEGWEVVPLFKAANIQYGFPFSTELFTEEPTNIPIVRIRDILDGTISAYSLENADEKYHLQERDVIVGMDGNFHMNYWHDNKAYLNQRCVRIRPFSNSTISSIQILYNIKPYIKAKEKNAKGSTVGHLSDKDLKNLFVLQPKTNPKFNPRSHFDEILKLIIKNKHQILSLTALRDRLLPLLMNGQVKVEG